jgi:hypothetical protein
VAAWQAIAQLARCRKPIPAGHFDVQQRNVRPGLESSRHDFIAVANLRHNIDVFMASEDIR